MAFASYSCVDDVLRKHRLRMVAEPTVTPAADAPPFSEAFRAELELSMTDLSPGRSEIGSGEILLFPILREVWKTYRQHLSLFSHEALDFDDDLCGYPDYFVCRVSEFGRIPEPPYLLVVEAKLDDFEKAWGQCLAEMLAAQKLNGAPDQPVYGIATNGKTWEFGVLLGNTFTQDPGAFAVSTLDKLGQALHAVFRACRDLALAYTASASANPLA
jgi:hypothetical protein